MNLNLSILLGFLACAVASGGGGFVVASAVGQRIDASENPRVVPGAAPTVSIPQNNATESDGGEGHSSGGSGGAPHSLIGWLQSRVPTTNAKVNITSSFPAGGGDTENSLVNVTQNDEEKADSGGGDGDGDEKPLNPIDSDDDNAVDDGEHPTRYRRFPGTGNGQQQQQQLRYRIPQIYGKSNVNCHIRRDDGAGNNRYGNDYDWYIERRRRPAQRQDTRKKANRKRRPTTTAMARPIYKQQQQRRRPGNSGYSWTPSNYPNYPVVALTGAGDPQTMDSLSWIQGFLEQNFQLENGQSSSSPSSSSSNSPEFVLMIPENVLSSKRHRNKKKNKTLKKQIPISTPSEDDPAAEESPFVQIPQIPWASAAIIIASDIQQNQKQKKKTSTPISIPNPTPIPVGGGNETEPESASDATPEVEQETTGTGTRYIVVGDDGDDRDDVERRNFHSGTMKPSPLAVAVFKRRQIRRGRSQLDEAAEQKQSME